MKTSRYRARGAVVAPPPPSPIPTGKGSRCAAVNDHMLSEYLDKSLQVPDLALPESCLPADAHLGAPAEIDLDSLVSRDTDSVDRFLESAAQFGVVRVSGHGISPEELGSTVAEAEWVFGVSEKREPVARRNCGRHCHYREEFAWSPSQIAMHSWPHQPIGPRKPPSFSQKMDHVARELDAIAEELGRVLWETIGRRHDQAFRTTTTHQNEEPVSLSLYRYYHYTNSAQTDLGLGFVHQDAAPKSHHAVSLHLPLKTGHFQAHSKQGPLSFSSGPDIIIVTIGKLLEDWSFGKYGYASGELIFHEQEGGAHATQQPSFSIELKSSLLSLNKKISNTKKMMITVSDQILIAFLLTAFLQFVCNSNFDMR